MEITEKYSYSKLEVYVNCPFKYKLIYVDKIKAFTQSVATELGTLVHETEEAIAHAIQEKRAINYDALKQRFIAKREEIKNKYPVDYEVKDKAGTTYEEKTTKYLETGIYNLEKFMKAHPTYEIVGIEQSFNFKYKKSYTFIGYIDRVFRDTATNHYIIQDIKTWPVPHEQKELTTPLQFVVYAMAARQLWGVGTESISCEYYLPFCELTQSAGTKGYLARGVSKIEKIFAGILEKSFAPKPSPLCNYCAFCPTSPEAPAHTKHMCPYFSHWTRENRKDFSTENEWMGMENHEYILEAYHKQYGIKG